MNPAALRAPTSEAIRKRCDRAKDNIDQFARTYRECEAEDFPTSTLQPGRRAGWEPNPTEAYATDTRKREVREAMRRALEMFGEGTAKQLAALDTLRRAGISKRDVVGSAVGYEWTEGRLASANGRSTRRRDRGRAR